MSLYDGFIAPVVLDGPEGGGHILPQRVDVRAVIWATGTMFAVRKIGDRAGSDCMHSCSNISARDCLGDREGGNVGISPKSVDAGAVIWAIGAFGPKLGARADAGSSLIGSSWICSSACSSSRAV